jgi:hypothetical protein
VVNKFLNLLMGVPITEAESPTSEPPTSRLTSKPPPTLDESQDSLKIALEKMKTASDEKVLCFESATEVFDDEDFRKFVVEVDVEVPEDEEDL